MTELWRHLSFRRMISYLDPRVTQLIILLTRRPQIHVRLDNEFVRRFSRVRG